MLGRNLVDNLLIRLRCALSINFKTGGGDFWGPLPYTEKKLKPFKLWQPNFSPGHNQIWIYDVTHICKMAPTPRNSGEGHFQALCCA